MKKRGLLTLVGICLVLLLVIPVIVACAKPSPTQKPAPATTSAAAKPTPATLTPAPAPATTSAPEVIKFRFATYVAGDQWWGGKHPQWFFNELAKRVPQKIEVQYFWSGTLLGATDIADGIARGAVEAGQIVIAYNPALYNLLTAADMPFVTGNPFAAAKAMASLARESLVEAEIQKLGLRFIAPGSVVEPGIWSKKPITTQADVKGLQIRATGRTAAGFKSLGAVPVGITLPETYISLERGVIDAAIFCIGDGFSMGLSELTKYFTLFGQAGFGAEYLGMNLGFYNKLPDNVKKVMGDLYWEHSVANFEASARADWEKAIETLVKKGFTVSSLPADEVEKWKPIAGKPIWDAWVSEKPELAKDRAWAMGRFQELAKTYEKEYTDRKKYPTVEDLFKLYKK